MLIFPSMPNHPDLWLEPCFDTYMSKRRRCHVCCRIPANGGWDTEYPLPGFPIGHVLDTTYVRWLLRDTSEEGPSAIHNPITKTTKGTGSLPRPETPGFPSKICLPSITNTSPLPVLKQVVTSQIEALQGNTAALGHFDEPYTQKNLNSMKSCPTNYKTGLGDMAPQKPTAPSRTARKLGRKETQIQR